MVKASIAKVLFWLCVIAILIASLIPSASSQLISGSDKIAHLVSFLVITFLLLSAYKLIMPYFTSVLLLAAFGLAIEGVQYYLPGRVFSLIDFAVDVLGIIIGIVLFKLFGPTDQATIKQVKVKN